MPDARARDNSDALATFIARKSKIDTNLARLTNFNCAPDAVN
jgi:hypothetical protein